MKTTRRQFIVRSTGLVTTAAIGAPLIARAQKKKLRFGVGPLLATPEDTKKAYMPFFTHLAKQLGSDFDLVATTDWAGMDGTMGLYSCQ